MGGETGKFVSAIWDDPTVKNTAMAVSFGTDCATLPDTDIYGTTCNTPPALHTNVGWDNITGVGTPNGEAFADAFAPAPTTK